MFTLNLRQGSSRYFELPNSLERSLDHASLATTGIYLHADDAELEAAASVMPDILNNPRKHQEEDELDVMREVVRGMG